MSAARNAALQALRKVGQDSGYSNIVLDQEIRRRGLSGPDAALATTLFYGVLEKQITLDYVLSGFSRQPLSRLDSEVLDILRLGAFQILYLDRIPDFSAVNEAVNAVKKNRRTARASGFVNAVLRSLLRSRDTLRYPDPEKDPLHSLSVRTSIPEWILRMWTESYGKERAVQIAESFTEKPVLYARVNTTRIRPDELIVRLREEGTEAERVPALQDALILRGTGSVTGHQSFREGLLHIQDLSSQICCAVLDPEPGETVADLCAAPGGKSFTIAERMSGTGRVLSFDLYRQKVDLIRSGARRLGLDNLQAAVRDAADPDQPVLQADRVLCDVPCSGFGVLRKKPEIRYRTEEEIRDLPDLQYRILVNGAASVRPGGILVYSTCTLRAQENREVADRFAGEHGDIFEPCPIRLPEGVERMVEEADHQLTILPCTCRSDGFFIAAFRRKQKGQGVHGTV